LYSCSQILVFSFYPLMIHDCFAVFEKITQHTKAPLRAAASEGNFYEKK